jgi:hypothetical protein
MTIEFSYPSQTPRHDAACAACQAPQGAPLLSGDMPAFKDFLDIINPLQQLPIVGTIYRSLTGDTISAGARMAGGALMGGPIGFLVSAINAGLEAATGGDVGEHLMAMVTGSGDTTQVAQAASAYQKTAALS